MSFGERIKNAAKTYNRHRNHQLHLMAKAQLEAQRKRVLSFIELLPKSTIVEAFRGGWLEGSTMAEKKFDEFFDPEAPFGYEIAVFRLQKFVFAATEPNIQFASTEDLNIKYPTFSFKLDPIPN